MTYFIDTHSHFDDDVFTDKLALAHDAVVVGMRHLLITGITQRTFGQIIASREYINSNSTLQTHCALGLHPAFVDKHQLKDLQQLERHIKNDGLIALGEIGLDTYEPWLKQADIYQQQINYFIAQLDLAVSYQLPVLLHIRKAHADALKILKNHAYNAHDLGGIAHSFSGGMQEATAFVNMGFKLGITGQITNPNAKKLRKAIAHVVAIYGIESLVIETDCPDMLPWVCQHREVNIHNKLVPHNTKINVPANLIYILDTLSDICQIPKAQLARQLWHNSRHALRQMSNVAWHYPDDL